MACGFGGIIVILYFEEDQLYLPIILTIFGLFIYPSVILFYICCGRCHCGFQISVYFYSIFAFIMIGIIFNGRRTGIMEGFSLCFTVLVPLLNQRVSIWTFSGSLWFFIFFVIMFVCFVSEMFFTDFEKLVNEVLKERFFMTFNCVYQVGLGPLFLFLFFIFCDNLSRLKGERLVRYLSRRIHNLDLDDFHKVIRIKMKKTKTRKKKKEKNRTFKFNNVNMKKMCLLDSSFFLIVQNLLRYRHFLPILEGKKGRFSERMYRKKLKNFEKIIKNGTEVGRYLGKDLFGESHISSFLFTHRCSVLSALEDHEFDYSSEDSSNEGSEEIEVKKEESSSEEEEEEENKIEIYWNESYDECSEEEEEKKDETERIRTEKSTKKEPVTPSTPDTLSDDISDDCSDSMFSAFSGSFSMTRESSRESSLSDEDENESEIETETDEEGKWGTGSLADSSSSSSDDGSSHNRACPSRFGKGMFGMAGISRRRVHPYQREGPERELPKSREKESPSDSLVFVVSINFWMYHDDDSNISEKMKLHSKMLDRIIDIVKKNDGKYLYMDGFGEHLYFLFLNTFDSKDDESAKNRSSIKSIQELGMKTAFSIITKEEEIFRRRTKKNLLPFKNLSFQMVSLPPQRDLGFLQFKEQRKLCVLGTSHQVLRKMREFQGTLIRLKRRRSSLGEEPDLVNNEREPSSRVVNSNVFQAHIGISTKVFVRSKMFLKRESYQDDFPSDMIKLVKKNMRRENSIMSIENVKDVEENYSFQSEIKTDVNEDFVIVSVKL